jgi:hypothetical protein
VIEGRSLIASRGDQRVTLTCPAGLEPTLVTGRDEPPLGWFSREFDVKSAAPTAMFTGGIRGNTVLQTHISIQRGPRPR